MPLLSRRRFLAQTAFASLAATHAFASSSDTVDVTTSLGVVRGEKLTGFNLFRGVPFAQPPVGPLRFRPPQPALPWPGIREATGFAPAPSQHKEVVPQSEDCLYLNIWTPSTPGPHPVFVWIHGGGYISGQSSDPVADGSHFARSGIVCVTVAYRLGVFGFLDWSPLLGEEYAGSANNALRDLILSLQWVQDHIADFGGDPHAVTIGGESAGAKLADILMGIPSAAPLFQQVVSESGGAERLWSKEQSLAVGEGWRDACKQAFPNSAADAAQAPAAEIIRIQEHFEQNWPVHIPLRPAVDDLLIKQWPLQMIRAGNSRAKRLLLGTNLDESSLFLGPHPQHAPTAHDLGNLTLQQYEPIAAHYPELYKQLNVEQQRIRAVTAEEYWVPSLRVADAHASAEGEAYVYRFDHPAASGPIAHYAFHAFELGFVWDKLPPNMTTEEIALALSMHAAWVSFIQGKTPSGPHLPPWPRYTTATRETMIFNEISRMESAPHIAEYHLWDGLLEH
ncbi:MAG: carboxylesterase family protein [Acidobacteriaceae bacterium]|nr:carboxylesterase family protein [Acidobacteriaceae bacterium]